jgi:hypothetical protein
MARKKTKSQRQVEIPRPIWENINPAAKTYEHDLHWAYIYAKENLSIKDFKKETLKYEKLEKEHVRLLNHLSPDHFISVGKRCWVLNQGGELADGSMDLLQVWINDLTEKAIIFDLAQEREKKAIKNTNKPDIQQRIREQVSNLIAEIEIVLDDFVRSGKFKTDFSLYEWLQKNQIKPLQTNKIVEYYRPLLAELEEVKKGPDDQLKEGYKWIKKARLNRYIQFVQQLVTDGETWSSNQKTVRKPRKKKELTGTKAVARLNYMKEDPQLRIVSVAPESILSASQLWIYNRNTRRITVYNALDRGGLQVHRSSIRNFNEETSVTKRLRQPANIIKRVLGGGKIILRKVMTEEVKTKGSVPNGRINKHCVLLRAIK